MLFFDVFSNLKELIVISVVDLVVTGDDIR